MNAVYEQLAPPAVLSRWVAAFWQLRDAEGDGTPGTQRVLPDGCVDILFDFGRWRASGRNVGMIAPATRLVGTMTRDDDPGRGWRRAAVTPTNRTSAGILASSR